MSITRILHTEGKHSILNEDNDVECERKWVLPEKKKHKGGDL